MLDFMRRNANSWVMILLFSIIIFVFAINFGPWAGRISGSVPYAATVNNQVISLAEFHSAYTNQLSRIKQFRPDYTDAQAEKDGLRQMVLDQLIFRELLTQLGQHKDLRVGPKFLAEEVKRKVFGPDKKFDKEEYKRIVNGYFQTSLSQFEEQLEKEIIAQQMVDLLQTAVYVSDDEAQKLYAEENTKISLDFVKVDPKFFPITKAASPQEIASYKPSHVKEISEYYSAHISDFVKEKEIQASHILVKFNSADKSNKEELKKRAEALLKRVQGGEDFAEVARSESDDVGSKTKGGDLGYFTSAMMVDEFAKAAFALPAGQISGVVESPFGFHIIKVTGEKPEQKRTEEQASDEIAELLIKTSEQETKAKDLAAQALKQLQAHVPLSNVQVLGLINHAANPGKEAPPHAPIADETDSFSRLSNYVLKIGTIDGLKSAAFALTLDHKTPKDVIKVGDDYFAIRLKSKTEADMAKFAEQKDTIKSRLEFPRRRAFVQQYLAQLKSAAKIAYNQDLMNNKAIPDQG